MRVLLTAGLFAASLQSALAQDAQTTESRSPERVSWEAESASSISSVSSRIGPFYTTFIFAPAVNEFDYVSVVGSGGPDDPAAETTTFKAHFKEDVEGKWSAETTAPWAVYANYTVGPTTFVRSVSYTQFLLTWTEKRTTETWPAYDMTTRCSYNEFLPKISIPDEAWRTMDWSTLQPDNWPTRNAVCSYSGWSSLHGSVTNVNTVYTLTQDTTVARNSLGITSDSLWRAVTVLGESPRSPVRRTMTSSGDAGKQTGAAQAGSGSGTEGAKATSTQAAGASEVTAWVNAVVVVAAAAAIAI